jgi:hypothetical protein
LSDRSAPFAQAALSHDLLDGDKSGARKKTELVQTSNLNPGQSQPEKRFFLSTGTMSSGGP